MPFVLFCFFLSIIYSYDAYYIQEDDLYKSKMSFTSLNPLVFRDQSYKFYGSYKKHTLLLLWLLILLLLLLHTVMFVLYIWKKDYVDKRGHDLVLLKKRY